MTTPTSRRSFCAGVGIALTVALTGCASTQGKKPVSGASGSDRPQPLKSLRAFVPTTMAFGAPMSGFGAEGKLDAHAKEVTVANWDGVEQLKSAVMQGQVDVAAAPANIAANLYNKGVDVRLVAPVVWGMLYVIGPATAAEGDWSALKGQKVVVALPGNMPDLVFSYLLAQNGLDRSKDIEIVPAQDGQQALAMVAQGQAQWAVMPEHVVTIALKKAAEQGHKLGRVLNLQQEWAKVTGGKPRIPMAGLIMPGKLVDERPDLVAAVRAEVAATVAKVNGGDGPTIKKVAEQYKMPEPLVLDVVTRLQLDVVSARQARAEYEDFLSRLGKANPAIYGGKLPDDKFYAS